MDTTFQIQAPHEAALALLKGKKPVASEIFYQLLPELRARAFTVSGVAGAGTLQRCRDSVAGVANGETWDDAKKALIEELDPWLGDGSEQRAETLLRTHGFQAFAAASHQTAMADDDTTHFQYLTMEDDRVRDSHAALDGVVLPKDDPFWLTHTPPWDWGCRCLKRAMNSDMVDEQKAEDRSRNPEDRNVIEGPALTQLRHGTLMRDGQRYDVTPPEDRQSEGDAYHFNPDDLNLSAADLEKRYDPEVWDGFKQWSQATEVADGITAWEWLNGKSVKPLSFPNVDEAQEYANANLHPDGLGLTAAERRAAAEYQESSIDLNKALQRGGELDPETQAQAQHLDAAIGKSALPEPLTVFHGGGGPYWGTLKAGDHIQLPSFLSTTLSANNRAFVESAWLKIHLPAGTNALYTDDLIGTRAFDNEVELLLGRGSKLKVLAVATENGVVSIEAELA